LVYPVVSSAGAAPPDLCDTRGEIVLTSPRVEVWAATSRTPARICHRPTGLVTQPEDEPPIADPDVDDRKAARRSIDTGGDYVGYAWESNDEECGYGGVVLVNARTGQAGWPRIYKCGSYTRFRRVVVRPSGAIAWGELHSIVVCRASCEEARSAPSTREVVARGRGVDTRSLRETRPGVAWRQRGRWRREPLR
jgi:hypothetical protein